MKKSLFIFVLLGFIIFNFPLAFSQGKDTLISKLVVLNNEDIVKKNSVNFSFHPLVTPKHQVSKARVFALGGITVGGFVFGYDQATKAWGRPTGKFHFKDDWTGDGMAQNDEVSHLLWGYRLTQAFSSGFSWAGYSPQKAELYGALEAGFVLTFIEYPMDSYNKLQGLGLSDLIFDYLGIETAVLKKSFKNLQNFDLKFSWKRNILKKGEGILVSEYEQFDNFVYWLTYKYNPFFKQKLFCLGLGYGTTHNIFLKPQRQIFLGMGVFLSELFSIFGKDFGRWTKPLDVFYPNINVKIYQSH
jgi:hypothetical protein